MAYIDLTRSIHNDMPVYPGDLSPLLEKTVFMEKGDVCNCSTLTTGMHVGTHIDAPFHMINGARKINEYHASKFIGRGVLINAIGKNIDIELLKGLNILKGDIVLIMTGWDKRFYEREYYYEYPDFTLEFAEELVGHGVNMVGIDTPSPDKMPFAIHRELLGKDVLIIENLTNLDKLTDKSFTVFAFPLNIDAEASPARVIAMTD